MLNRFSPKLPGKIGRVPKFTAEDFTRQSIGSGKQLPERAVIVFSQHLFEAMKHGLGMKKTDFPYGGLFDECVTEDASLLSVKIYPGGPLAAATTEELISLGVRKFLVLGTAGSISRKARINDIVLCKRALRDEGTSYHYIRPSNFAYPSSELTSKLAAGLAAKGIRALSGSSWTTDAPYMETLDEIEQYSSRGILTVEMEAASVFAVATARKVNSAALFSISDELYRESWTGISIPESGFESLLEAAKIFSNI